MQAHTNEHHTENDEHSISAKDYMKSIYGDLPKWAIILAGYRHRENLTQKELGKIVGIKQCNISRMETGHCPIGKNAAKKFAIMFNTDYRMFL